MSRLLSLSLLLLLGCGRGPANASEPASAADAVAKTPAAPPALLDNPKSLTEDDWKSRLSSSQFRILREAGTEMAYTGPYWNSKDEGHYYCAGCGQPLFSSTDKFKSGTGWPSYTRTLGEEAVATKTDASHGMVRVEALCARCGGHLGHLFDDGPAPTFQRWCINGAALTFAPAAAELTP